MSEALLAFAEQGGLPFARAKRGLERALDGENAALHLPHVPDPGALLQRLTAAGVRARIVTPGSGVDIPALRKRLNMTQEEFSILFGIKLDTLQNYETGRRKPDCSTIAYLELIRSEPEAVMAMRLDQAAGSASTPTSAA